MAKRPIDLKRDSGGKFTIGEPGETTADMFVVDDRLLTVTTGCVYATNMADKIDPSRTDINLPNVITQQVLGYGSSTPFIGRTLLLGRELFDRAHLGGGFDNDRALKLSFEAAQHLASMTDIAKRMEEHRKQTVAQIVGKPVGNAFKLPTTPNLRSEGEAFTRHADQTHQSTKQIADLFYPRKKANDNWSAHIVESLRTATDSNEQSAEFLAWAVSHIDCVRNIRNASEHPDDLKHVRFFDFALEPGLKIIEPTVEIQHAETPQQRINLLNFMNSLIEECSGIFEGMAALLCDTNMKLPGPFVGRVARLDDEKSKARFGLNYTYQVTLKPGVELPKPTKD